MEKFEKHTGVILFLLATTLITVLSFYSGGFDQDFDVLGYKHSRAYSSTIGDVVSEVYSNGENAGTICTFGTPKDRSYCVLSIRLANNEFHGLDLSRFDSLSLSFRYRAEFPASSIFGYMINLHPSVESREMSEFKKYNKLTLPSAENIENLRLSLDTLNTPDWWLRDYLTDPHQAHVDLSNVTAIQFAIDDDLLAGRHELNISKLVLHGKWISIELLYFLLFMMWLITALVSFFYQKYMRVKDANEDELTGLLNRRGLRNWLDSSYHRDGMDRIVMLYIDIDDFKKVNDSRGHQIGDKLLQAFALRVKRVMDTALSNLDNKPRYGFARLSGDEFGLAVEDLTDESIEIISSEIIRSITRPFHLAGIQVRINASIGVALSEFRAKTPESLINNADMAMYHSKRNGKNQYQLFDQKLSNDIIQRKSISSGIRKAIDNYNFDLVYMPIYRCHSRTVAGAEVLIRSSADELMGFGPDIFIPISEEYGLIKEIDLWVLERALQRMGDFPLILEDFKFCINISALELHNSDFPNKLAELLQRYRIPAKNIELEITETSLVGADHLSMLLLEKLRKIGVRLSLDDFGTGYTGFNQLLNYPIEVLKIDQSFITEIDNKKSRNAIMVNAILSIAKSYSLETVGEGVESEQHLQFLEENGCDYVQGFYLSEPLPWERFLNLIRQPLPV